MRVTNILGNNNEDQTGPYPQRGQGGEPGEAGARAGGGPAARGGGSLDRDTEASIIFYLSCLSIFDLY